MVWNNHRFHFGAFLGITRDLGCWSLRRSILRRATSPPLLRESRLASPLRVRIIHILPKKESPQVRLLRKVSRLRVILTVRGIIGARQAARQATQLVKAMIGGPAGMRHLGRPLAEDGLNVNVGDSNAKNM